MINYLKLGNCSVYATQNSLGIFLPFRDIICSKQLARFLKSWTKIRLRVERETFSLLIMNFVDLQNCKFQSSLAKKIFVVILDLRKYFREMKAPWNNFTKKILHVKNDAVFQNSNFWSQFHIKIIIVNLIDFLNLFKNSWTFHFSKALRDVKQKQRHSTKLTSLFELLLTISEILQGCPIYHVMESFWDWNYLKLCKATTCKQTTKNFWRQENTSLFMPWNFFETETIWT